MPNPLSHISKDHSSLLTSCASPSVLHLKGHISHNLSSPFAHLLPFDYEQGSGGRAWLPGRPQTAIAWPTVHVFLAHPAPACATPPVMFCEQSPPTDMVRALPCPGRPKHTHTGRVGMVFGHHRIQSPHCQDGKSEDQAGKGSHTGSGPSSCL